MASNLLNVNRMLPEEILRFFLDFQCKLSMRLERYLSIILVTLQKLDIDTCGNLISEQVRETDIFGVLEFRKVCVILPSANFDHLINILARIQTNIQDHITCSQEDQFNYRIKIGGACLPTHGTTPKDLLWASEENSRDIWNLH